jgi:hypothetical protein
MCDVTSYVTPTMSSLRSPLVKSPRYPMLFYYIFYLYGGNKYLHQKMRNLIHQHICIAYEYQLFLLFTCVLC